MAQSGYTPIQLYYSTTASAIPLAANLANGELAINITDGKIYYKNNSGVVTLFGSTGDVSTISFGTTGLTPSTATGGAITVAGTLITSNGGTGLSSYTAGDLPYYASGAALSKLGIGTNGYILQSNGSAPTWVAASSVVGGAGGSNTQVQYNSSGSLAGSSLLTFDGTTLTAPGTVISVNTSTDALRITQTGTGNALLVEDSSNPDSTPFVIDATGNVISGYTTSVVNAGSAVAPRIQVHGAGGGSAAINATSWQSGADVGSSLVLSRSEGTTIGTQVIVDSNDILGTVRFAGSDGTAFIQAAAISAAVDGTPGTNDMPGRLVFSTTADGASSPTERMRIDSSGDVSIGTSSPTAMLHTAGSSSVAALKTPNILEISTVSATAATGTINYDVTTQSVLYYTTNASGNFTLNFRGSSGTSLNTIMATGDTVTVTFLCTNGSTAYYNSAVQIDGSSVTPKWQGGTAPSSGNASACDIYTYAIVKTGSATFTVFASQTKFA